MKKSKISLIFMRILISDIIIVHWVVVVYICVYFCLHFYLFICMRVQFSRVSSGTKFSFFYQCVSVRLYQYQCQFLCNCLDFKLLAPQKCKAKKSCVQINTLNFLNFTKIYFSFFQFQCFFSAPAFSLQILTFSQSFC